jgi:hypothetical protein
MDYKFLFLVGSAINHFKEDDLSAFNAEERFQQTLDTLQSIKDKVPDAYILIYEASETPIKQEYKISSQNNLICLLNVVMTHI